MDKDTNQKNQALQLQYLTALGQEQGYLTLRDIQEYLLEDNIELEQEQLDDLVQKLVQMDIKVDEIPSTAEPLQSLQERGSQAKPQELAERILVSGQRLFNALQVPKEPLSIETPIFEDDEAPLLGDFLKDELVQSPLDAATSVELQRTIEGILAELKPREAQILRMRFGIGNDCDHTLEAVGTQFNVTRERIRQIEATALHKLRKLSGVTALKSFLD